MTYLKYQLKGILLVPASLAGTLCLCNSNTAMDEYKPELIAGKQVSRRAQERKLKRADLRGVRIE